MSEKISKLFPKGFYWDEKVLGALSQEVASYFKLAKSSDNLNNICKIQQHRI